MSLTLLLLLVGVQYKPTTLITPPFSHDFGFHRISKFYLDMYLGRNFQFGEPEGIVAEKLKIEDDTTTSQDDHILTLFGINSREGQIIYNSGLKGLRVYGRTGSGRDEFRNPHGIAVNREGQIYVADTDNKRIVKLRYQREGIVYDTAFAFAGVPYGVALDSRGKLYVTDYEGSRIVVMDSTGTILATWTGPDRPTGIAVLDRSAESNYYGENLAIVVDRDGHRISRLDLEGRLEASVEARDIGLSVAGFSYCALDYYASVYVTDRINDQIHKFDRTLNFLVSFGRSGGAEGEFRSPRGITIGRRFGQLFINEAEGGQYYWIGLDAYLIGCYPEVMTPTQPGTTIAIYTTDVADVAINVYDKKRRLVRNLYPGGNREKPGELLVMWDGCDDFGTAVLPGEYTIKATLKPTYGGARRILKKELSAKVIKRG